MVSEETPWVGGDVLFTRAAIDAIEADALSRYAAGEEACGYVRGPADAPLDCDEVVPLPNLANKLHALDPETYFRDARTFFAFNEKKFDDAVHAGRAAGRPVKILYHSHLDAGAYFSPTDRAVLSTGVPPAREGERGTNGAGPAWPLAFLVTSVRGGEGGPRIDGHALFVWRDGDFVEGPFRIA